MLTYRKATIADVDLIFNWSNDPIVRISSFNYNQIAYDEHVAWYIAKMNDNSTFFYIFSNASHELVGLVRIEKKLEGTVISIMIDKRQRGKSYASEMLLQATTAFFTTFPNEHIHAYIKKDNIASIKSFAKAGFTNQTELLINNIPSIVLKKILS